MVINHNTKIAALIKHNPATIDSIASINKHFKKLKNPILRKVLARRIDISDAAKVGGVTLEEFYRVLVPLGFRVEKMDIEVDEVKDVSVLKFNANVVSLDVRPILDGGTDPFKAIMKELKSINEGAVLKVTNTFEPIPLINILKGKGYQIEVDRPEDGIVDTYILKHSPSKIMNPLATTIPEIHNKEEVDFDSIIKRYDSNIKEIDVRAMEMPEPMVTILTEIETLDSRQLLFVKHKKFPQYLIPELQKRGYSLVDKRIDDYNVNLLIFKN